MEEYMANKSSFKSRFLHLDSIIGQDSYNKKFIEILGNAKLVFMCKKSKQISKSSSSLLWGGEEHVGCCFYGYGTIFGYAS